jgi:hypothetical protein
MFPSIRKNKTVCSYFYKILAIATKSNEIIEGHEATILKCKVMPVITRMRSRI